MSTPFSFIKDRRVASRAVVLTVSISSTDGVLAAWVRSPLLARNNAATADAGGPGRGSGTETEAVRSSNDAVELCRVHICRMGYVDGWTKPCRPRDRAEMEQEEEEG